MLEGGASGWAAWGREAVLLLLLLSAGCVAEQPPGALYATAQREEAVGHYEEAVYWYRRAARSGSIEAQERLAEVLARGRFGSDGDGHVVGYVRPAPEEAARWRRASVDAYKEAARRGDTEAQIELADLYLTGRGVEEDRAKGRHMLRDLAVQGHAKAQYALGILAVQDQDEARALRWIRRSAEGGHVEAMSYMAFLYETGRGGVEQDSGRAAHWLRRAADRGDEAARRELRLLKKHGVLAGEP